MDKWMLQADSTHQLGPETILQGVLIVVESGGRGGWKSCRNFSLSEIGPDFACASTTGNPMDKWMLQADSAHQIGLKPTLHAFLIAGCWCCTRGWRCVGGIFCSQTLIGHENFFAIYWRGTLPTCQSFMGQEGKCQPAWLIALFISSYFVGSCCWWSVLCQDYIRVRGDIQVRCHIQVRWCILIQCPQYNTWYSDNSNGGSYWQVLLPLWSYSQVYPNPKSQCLSTEIDLSTYHSLCSSCPSSVHLYTSVLLYATSILLTILRQNLRRWHRF